MDDVVQHFLLRHQNDTGRLLGRGLEKRHIGKAIHDHGRKTAHAHIFLCEASGVGRRFGHQTDDLMNILAVAGSSQHCAQEQSKEQGEFHDFLHNKSGEKG